MLQNVARLHGGEPGFWGMGDHADSRVGMRESESHDTACVEVGRNNAPQLRRCCGRWRRPRDRQWCKCLAGLRAKIDCRCTHVELGRYSYSRAT